MGFLGLNDDTYLQLNVYNLTNSFFVGGFSSGLIQSNTLCTAANTANIPTNTSPCRNQPVGTSNYGNPNNSQIGAPRAVSATVVFKF